MSSDQSTHLNRLIERLPTDPNARSELIECSYERLRWLTKKILREDYPRLKQIHETGTVVHEAVLRLLHSLEQVHPKTVREFFSFSALQIRRTLLDLARQHRSKRVVRAVGRGGEDSSSIAPNFIDEPSDTRNDPQNLAVWNEFHQKVDELPPTEREVVDLHWYHGLTQAETAKILELHPKEVSRRWLRARLQLPDWAP